MARPGQQKVPKTFRVSGIPETEDVSSTARLLEEALGPCEPEVHSLAPDPSLEQSDLVATVTFKPVPALLSGNRTRWQLREPYPIVIDNDFRGITPLGGSKGDQQATT